MTAVAEGVRTPYKGLSPFDDSELDALLFFGRERETKIVVANAVASRLTVLYGPSGVGKSSLLRAGVVHSMRKLTELEPITVAYFSTWAGDPVTGIEEAARGALTDAFGGDPGDVPGDLAERLDAWTAALGCELCLVLDQFEELFLYHEDGGLLEALPELVTRPGLRVNVVLGIRDDELAKLDVFKARIPGLFSNYLRLDLLDRDAARAAILGPLDRYNELQGEHVTIEPELVEAVLGEVAAGRIDPGLSGRGTVAEPVEDRTRVETPYLQLVMQKLWEVERERQSHVLRLSTLAELGGAQRIVEDHLEHAMDALTPLQRDVAAGMFEHLVTPSGAKIAHGVSDLASFARVEESDVEPVLSSLSRERILRPTGENGHAGDRYEIYHDVLAGAVLAWRAKHEAESALARERIAARRRQRRLAIMVGISFAAFALMSALAAYAVSQRSSARHEAALALAQTASAKRATRAARAATSRELRQKTRAQRLSGRYQRSAANERRLRKSAVAQQRQLDAQNTKLAASAAQLERSNRDLRSQTAIAHHQTTLAKQNANVAHKATAKARQKTRIAVAATKTANAQKLRAIAAVKETKASERLQKAQLELAVDPARSVKDALTATHILRSQQAENVLRSSLQAMNVLAELRAADTAVQAAYSPDSKRLALADRAGQVRIFSVPDGKLVQQPLRNGSPLNGVAWAPDGHTIATAASDGKVRVWNLDAPQSPVRVLTHGAPARSVAFSPDGRLLLTSGARDAKLWETASYVLLHTLPSQRPARSAAFSPDGSLIVTVENSPAAHVWDAATGDLLSTLTQRQEITAAAFGPNGTLIVTGSRDGTGRIWESRTGTASASLEGHTSQVLTVAFSPAGDRVATGSVDGTARWWNLAGIPVDIIRGAASSVVSVAFAPSGQSLVSAGSDGNANTSGVGQREQNLYGQAGPMKMAVFAPDGATVATVGGSTARLWEPYGEPVLRGIHRYAGAATSVSFDPTGRLLASGGADGIVVIQRTSGAPLRSLNVGSPVVSTTWARDGLLLAATQDGTAHLYPGGEAAGSRTIAHGSKLVAAAMRDDGAVVATAGVDGVVRLWGSATGALLSTLPSLPNLAAVALDPTGRLVAAAAGTSIFVSDARTGQQLAILSRHTDKVTGLAFSHDGQQLASSSKDKDAWVWNARTLRPVKVLHRHTAFVSGVAFSYDDRWIATAGPSKAGVWSAHANDLSGSFLQYLRGNDVPITSVAFSPLGWKLATAARDGDIRIVDCKLCGRLPQLESYARTRLAVLDR